MESVFIVTEDGSICRKAKASNSEESETSEVHIGHHMVDTPGFGDNRGQDLQEDSLTASLDAIEQTLLAVNRTKVRAFAWLVPCAERRSKKEALDLMTLFKEMSGAGVPIIAIFNPGSAENTCVKKPSEFQELAARHKVVISEVIHFDNFDLKSIQSRYTMEYQVMIPGNLHDLLKQKDVKHLASQLQDFRRTRCQSLPSELQETRNFMAGLRGEIQVENVAANCTWNECPFKEPTLENSSSKVCSSEELRCEKYGRRRRRNKKTCTKVCAEYKVVTDQECVERNKERMALARETVDDCHARAKEQHDECLKVHAASQEEIKQKNEELRESILALSLAEKDLLAKQKTCDKVTGVNAEL